MNLTDVSPNSLEALGPEKKALLLQLLEEKDRRKRRRKYFDLFPDEGEFRRELYPKHLEFFRLGADHRERLFLAGNRVGKTIAGGYECTAHLTGKYPKWWEGRIFPRPTRILAAGDTIATTRDIIQEKLFGPNEEIGTGLIPGDLIVKTVNRGAVTGAFDYGLVKHRTGGNSIIRLRSYDQGRKIFQGFESDVIWLDEECPIAVYEEALIRTMTTGGIVILTFTPLSGLTPLVLSFLPGGKLAI